MAREQYEVEILASPEKVFSYMDDINNIGWHMSGERSMPMIGGRLRLETVDDRKGVGATYRWKGSVMGMVIDIEETVTRYTIDREKTWQTIGRPKMIVMSDYVMHLLLTPTGRGTHVMFEIDYSLPKTLWGRIIGRLLARRYAKWCVRKACEDAKRTLGSRTEKGT